MEADQVPTLTDCQNWKCDCRQGLFCARRDAGLPNALDDFLDAVAMFRQLEPGGGDGS